jgi:hypothetical protein
MESNMQPDPILRSYDDATVLLLETLHDPFFARELEQRRFSKTQEGEWITRIAEDVRKNERAVRITSLCVLFSISTHHARPRFAKRPPWSNAGSLPSRYRTNGNFAILSYRWSTRLSGYLSNSFGSSRRMTERKRTSCSLTCAGSGASSHDSTQPPLTNFWNLEMVRSLLQPTGLATLEV